MRGGSGVLVSCSCRGMIVWGVMTRAGIMGMWLRFSSGMLRVAVIGEEVSMFRGTVGALRKMGSMVMSIVGLVLMP